MLIGKCIEMLLANGLIIEGLGKVSEIGWFMILADKINAAGEGEDIL